MRFSVMEKPDTSSEQRKKQLIYQSHSFRGQERCWKSLEVYSSLERSEASEYTEGFSNIVLDRQNNVISIIIYCNRFPKLRF